MLGETKSKWAVVQNLACTAVGHCRQKKYVVRTEINVYHYASSRLVACCIPTAAIRLQLLKATDGSEVFG